MRDTAKRPPPYGKSKSKWISVKDRLPKEEALFINPDIGMCLVGHIEIEMRGNSRAYLCESDATVLYDVTHWMPLPEPPKE